jgi:hypothetical protein
MRTKLANLSTDPVARFDAATRRPHTWHVSGIDAFWLENAAGAVLTDKYQNTGPVYEAVLAHVARGVDPEGLLMAGQKPDGKRTIIGGGVNLLDLAEAHAGVPARRRIAPE